MCGITGVLAEKNGALCVMHETTYSDRPALQRVWWAVDRVTVNPYTADRPAAGDIARAQGSSVWHTERPADHRVSGSVRTVLEACAVEETPVPRPKVRGEVRWYQGRWEKLLKRGWVAA